MEKSSKAMGTTIESNGKQLPRIIVGILAGSSLVDSAFAETFSGGLIGHGELFWAEQSWAHGGIPDDNRNGIVEVAKEHDADYIFFMDSDMVFPKTALLKLIVAQQKIIEKWPELKEKPTVVGGLYCTRSDHRQNVYAWDEKVNSFKVDPVEPNTGIYKCDFVATGCQLVDMGVFDALDYPYFEYWYKEFGVDNKKTKWSEDAVFGKKCYDAGIPHFVESNVVCKHVHSALIYPVSKKEYQIEGFGGRIY